VNSSRCIEYRQKVGFHEIHAVAAHRRQHGIRDIGGTGIGEKMPAGFARGQGFAPVELPGPYAAPNRPWQSRGAIALK
jgi:hypothetical protein